MKLEFLLIDVFTDRPFGGSRLYLFPGGGDVPEEQMQKLAMELGPGETAFLVPARSGGEGRSGLRVFTPSAEIPFGGHSVLGATFALDHYGGVGGRYVSDRIKNRPHFGARSDDIVETVLGGCFRGSL